MLKDTVKESAALDIAICDIKIAPAAKPPVDLASINTLHELLALALDDFEKVLADKRYGIDMTTWHGRVSADQNVFDRCHVCLAGAVIAHHLGTDISCDVHINQFSDPVAKRLCALDDLRCGQITSAYMQIGRIHWNALPVALEHRLSGMSSVWAQRIDRSYEAHGRKEGRRLLAKLRLMQVELAEAGI